MSTPPQDGWPSQQRWDSGPADEDQPYGQPFDPTVSSPKQQPPPPGWEQGTWTHHGVPAQAEGTGRWMLVGMGVLAVVIIAAAVVFLAV